jgi:hypothetical protein
VSCRPVSGHITLPPPPEKILAVLSLREDAVALWGKSLGFGVPFTPVYKFAGFVAVFLSFSLPVTCSILAMSHPYLHVIHLDHVLPYASTLLVYDSAVSSFLSLRDSWAACLRFHCEVTEWLYVFQGAWVGLCFFDLFCCRSF